MQLLAALADLKKLGILHTDLKPDSVMFADEDDLRIKIISFGLALLEHEATPGITIQAPGIRWPPPPATFSSTACLYSFVLDFLTSHFDFCLFRAPEIMFGLPFSYPIDMWGVGQILLYLYNPDTLWRRSSYQNASKRLERFLSVGASQPNVCSVLR